MTEPWKPSPEQLEAARAKRVRDLVAPDLAVLFCGINPGLYSGAVGHHFARPGNRFWPALHGSGFTPRLLSPFDESELLAHGLGVTNFVSRTTATAAELSPEELESSGPRSEIEGPATPPPLARAARRDRLPSGVAPTQGGGGAPGGRHRSHTYLAPAEPQWAQRSLPAPRPDRRVRPSAGRGRGVGFGAVASRAH